MNPQIKQKGLVSFRFLIGIGAFLFLIFSVAYLFYGLQPGNLKGEMTQFKIAKGEGFKVIGAHLSQKSLIKSLAVFKFYSLISGKVQKFQPGVYELSGAMSVPEIVGVLTSSGKNEAVVVLTEGLTAKDFARILENNGVVEAEAITNYRLKNLTAQYPFLEKTNSLEGFLFPDTYRFHRDSSAEEVLKRMLNNFELKAWPLLSAKENWYDYLILASFLEREVPDFNDRQLVAGILLKRLSRGIPLQVDSTISYAKCAGELKNCPSLVVTKNDLAAPSSYNTYQKLGLTPTPIANPGQAAIKAALTPQSSRYLYYLSAAKTKETIFSKTLEEHNRNRVKYL